MAEPRPALGEEVELLVSDLLTNGQAVGRIGGSVVFVFGPLPGERARVRITATKQRYLVAELIELLTSSPDRVVPFCPFFGRCGGCQLQHLSYEAQLLWKRETVVQALRRIGGLDGVEVAPTIGMDVPRAYRNKMSLVVGEDQQVGQLGFYEMRSHELVPIDECQILLPALQADLAILRRAIRARATRAAFVDARHVVVRRARSTGEGVLAITSMKALPGVAQCGDVLRQTFAKMVGLSNSFAPTGENVVLGRNHRTISGTATLEESLAGIHFQVSVQSFFQVNGEMLERILAILRPKLEKPMRIIDLYCGAGTFAVAFACLGSHVFGREENPLAVEESKKNAERNCVQDRTSFSAGRVEHFAQEAVGRREFSRVDVIFLDPPRKGSDVLTLTSILESSARQVWYLSCNPATLARDSAILIAGGFIVDFVQPFDMFPQTGHIEVLLTLSRNLPGDEALTRKG